MKLIKSSFPLLIEELSKRWKAPIGQVSFFVYLIVAVIGIGAIGIWVEISRAFDAKEFDSSGLITAIYTYFPAIAAGSSLQLLMGASKEEEKVLRSFCIFSAFVVLILTLPFFSKSNSQALLWFSGILGVLFSLWLWWITNGDSPCFQDINPGDSLGDDPESEPAGKLRGFKF